MGVANGAIHQVRGVVMTASIKKKKTAAKKSMVDNQLQKGLRSLRSYAAGKVALKTTILDRSGERSVFWETLPEAKLRRERLARFKVMRANLDLTQPEMAGALQVSVNTLKGWEAGKPIPGVAFVLAELLHDVPTVRKKLLSA